jgi:hypothetical protein
MHKISMIGLAFIALAALSGCSETSGGSGPSASAAKTPSADEQACLAAVSREANNGDVAVLSSEFSQANTQVMIGVGPQKAQWKCLVSGGQVAEVTSMTNEGTL